MKEAVIELINKQMEKHKTAVNEGNEEISTLRYGKVLGMLDVARELELISVVECEAYIYRLDYPYLGD